MNAENYLGSMENQLSSSKIISPGLSTLEILHKIQDKLEAHQTCPEEIEERIILMSMFIGIDWTKKENSKECFSNTEKV